MTKPTLAEQAVLVSHQHQRSIQEMNDDTTDNDFENEFFENHRVWSHAEVMGFIARIKAAGAAEERDRLAASATRQMWFHTQGGGYAAAWLRAGGKDQNNE